MKIKFLFAVPVVTPVVTPLILRLSNSFMGQNIYEWFDSGSITSDMIGPLNLARIDYR